MPPLLRLAAIAACLLAVAVAAPVASAAPRDKADAAAVRKATIALHGYILAQKPAIEASFRRFEDPACVKALRGAPDAQTEALLNDYLLPVLFETLIHPLQNGMTKLVTDLNAVPLSDPVLRSGRAGWRVLAGRFGQIAAPPSDLCAPLDAWRQAGYPASARPKVNDPAARGAHARRLQPQPRPAQAQPLGRPAAEARRVQARRRLVDGDTLLDGIDVSRALG